MANIRIKDIPTTATSSSSGDFLAVDGTGDGTRKLNAHSPRFGGNLTVDGSITGGSASLTTPLPLTSGGTGASTQAGAANAVLPSQSTNSGKYLTTDGSNVSWGSVSGGTWGSITGTLSNQTDLQNALDAKANTSSLAASATTDTTNASNITSGTLSTSRLSGITTSQLSASAGITNGQLANSAITIAGTSTSLGGSITQDTITGLSTTGIIKRTTTNTLAVATANTDYLTPSGPGSSLTGITATQVGLGNVTNHAQTKESVVPNTIPSAGQILVGNAGGTAYGVVSTSGDVTLASTGALTIGSQKVTNAMLAGSIDLTTKVTGTLPIGNGGTNATTAANAATNLGLGTGSDVTHNSVSDVLGNVRSVPQVSKTSSYTLVATDNGQHISITTGGVTVPASVFSTGNIVTIYNNSTSNQTITQGASATLRQAGTANTGNRTLAQYGVCTILCVASNTFVISGAGLT